jgi:hypothetical protein
LIPDSIKLLSTSFSAEASKLLCDKLHKLMIRRLEQNNSMDLEPRMEDLWRFVGTGIGDFEELHGITLKELNNWRAFMTKNSVSISRSLKEQFSSTRKEETSKLDVAVSELLGDGSKVIYHWLRETVGVRFRRGDVAEGGAGVGIGAMVGKVVKAWEELGKREEEVGACDMFWNKMDDAVARRGMAKL